LRRADKRSKRDFLPWVLATRSLASANGKPTITTGGSLHDKVVRMGFAGADAKPTIVGLEPLPGITNYFVGKDPNQWHTDITSFAKALVSVSI
jgi:hypothetical protein